MQLTIHLFEDGDWTPDSLLRSRQPDDPSRWTEEPRLRLDFECVAIGTFREQDAPIWAEYLDGYFDIDWRGVISTSAVVLVRVDQRWFAVTFGQGRHLLRPEILVSNFGLRVTANTVPADRVRSLASTSLDGTLRRSRQSLSVPGRVSDFTVDLLGEWVGSLGGRTDDDLTRGMTGSQSLAVELGPGRTELKQLDELLRYLLDRYHADDYQAHFPFVDLITPVHRDDPRVERLDAELVTILRTRRGDFGVIFPDPQPGDLTEYTYRIVTGRPNHRRSMDVLGVRQTAYETPEPLSRRVEVLDPDGILVRHLALKDFLTAQMLRPDAGRFVLVQGRWYLINPRRYAWLRQCLADIPELPADRLAFPKWFRRRNEGAYNEKAAGTCRWRLMDKKNFLGPDRRRDKIEVCDLLTPQMHMICVKKLTDARSMSHLFCQGSVSARLYHDDPGYQKALHGMFRESWPDLVRHKPTLVYAIGTERHGALVDTLPFFSQINLCNHARAVRGMGIDVAIAPIVLTSIDPDLVSSVPDQRSGGLGQGALFARPDDLR